jgi:putative MFS transporter
VIILGVTANACAYGILTWLPTLFTTVYGLPVQTALNYSLLVTVGGALCYFILSVIVDLVPRRILFMGGLVLGSIPLFILWALKGGTAQQVQFLAPTAYLFIVVGLSGVFLHSAELFPTVLRARATGLMAACSRLSIMTSPLIVGYLLEHGGVADVFLFFALCVFIGGILTGLLGTETRGIVLSDMPTPGDVR